MGLDIAGQNDNNDWWGPVSTNSIREFGQQPLAIKSKFEGKIFMKVTLNVHLATLIVSILCFPLMITPSALSASVSIQETGKDTCLLDRALEVIAMKRQDLSIRPDLFEVPFTLSCFKRWMENPLDAPLEAQHAATHLLSSAHDPVLWLKALSGLGDLPVPEPISAEKYQDHMPPLHLPRPLREAVTLLLDGMYTAERTMDKAKAGISTEGMKNFERHLYPDYISGEILKDRSLDTVKFKDLRKTIHAAESVDKAQILKAGLVLLTSVGRAREILTTTENWREDVRTISFETTLGVVRIGGTGPDVHDTEADLIIDLGGDDLYMGKVASGRNGNCSVVLDLDGDDRYLGEDLTQAAGFWGIGILFDLKGNDLYRAGDFAQGAGFFGIGLLMDAEGDDTYLGKTFVQAASSLGWGGLMDLAGEDVYQCQHSGQAYSGFGGISCLSDIKGNDKYISGASVPDPREPDMNQSFSQGFAFGMRNLTGGGFAILADRWGSDVYQCQYFGQGASYWMGIGVLYDEDGKDTYIARRYAQGAGIHFSFGLLMDAGGNDHTSSWGVSQGCGHDYGMGLLINGAGNDSYVSSWLSTGASEASGVGIFVDNEGDDGYETNAGTALGQFSTLSRAGGIGLFMDAGGKDRYSMNGADNSVWSETRWAVGIDANGAGISGLNIRPPEETGPVDEVAESRRMREEESLLRLLVRAEEAPYPENIELMLSVASHWGFEKNIPRAAQEKLLQLEGSESVPAMVELLDTPNVLSLRFMHRLFTVHAYHALPALMKATGVSDPLVKSRAFYFIGRLEDSRALDQCIEALRDSSWRVKSAAIRAIGEILNRRRLEELQPMREAFLQAMGKNDPRIIIGYLKGGETILQVLSVVSHAMPMDYRKYTQYAEMRPGDSRGEILEAYGDFVFDRLEKLTPLLEKWVGDIQGAEAAGRQLMPYLSEVDPALRKTAAYSLGQLRAKPAVPELITLLGDPDLEVRDAALRSLAHFGEEALDPLLLAMERQTPSFKIWALDLLSRINGEQARKAIEQYAKDPNPNVRRMAAQILDR